MTVSFSLSASNYSRSATAIIGAARATAPRGWVPATAEDFSARIDEISFIVTRSGVGSGSPTPDDLTAQTIDASLEEGSFAETAPHRRRYRDTRQTGAIYHVRSPAASVIARAHASCGAVRIEGWELQKASRGFTSHESMIETLVFESDQDVEALAEQPNGAVPAPSYALAGHSLTARGTGARDAWRRHEALEAHFQQILVGRSCPP